MFNPHPIRNYASFLILVAATLSLTAGVSEICPIDAHSLIVLINHLIDGLVTHCGLPESLETTGNLFRAVIVFQV